MEAIVTTSNRGNLALQSETWKIPTIAAKAVIEELGKSRSGSGTYWETVLVKPTRKATRSKSDFVTVFTAGFSTSELSNCLREIGCKIVSQ